MWHVRKHELEHLEGYRARFPSFEQAYRRWVRSDTPVEFESRWANISHEFNIEARSWLWTMYNKREHWVQCYLKDTFWAGMTTTGRSESMNAYFDGYANSNTMLNEFVAKYDKSVRARRDVEEREDLQTMNTQPTFSSTQPIKKATGERYTRRIFRKFQAEFIASNGCRHETLTKDACSGLYRVGQMEDDRRKWQVVQFTAYEGFRVRCSCALSKTMGVLCQHALYVLKKKKVMELPDYYV